MSATLLAVSNVSAYAQCDSPEELKKVLDIIRESHSGDYSVRYDWRDNLGNGIVCGPLYHFPDTAYVNINPQDEEYLRQGYVSNDHTYSYYYNVFISYPCQYNDLAQKIASKLRSRNYKVFTYRDQNACMWMPSLYQIGLVMRKAKVHIVLTSKHVAKNSVVRLEAKYFNRICR